MKNICISYHKELQIRKKKTDSQKSTNMQFAERKMASKYVKLPNLSPNKINEN